MLKVEQFTIGAAASCSDGICGVVTEVVVDPVGRAVTHLVVEPKHRKGLGRLVPLDLVGEVSELLVQLSCTTAQFEELEHAEETQFLPGSGGLMDFPIGVTLPEPFFGLTDVIGGVPQAVTYDSLPIGEVAIQRGEHVDASDGRVGVVQGLVVDPQNQAVTHVLLQEGHVWGRKQLAIPISMVERVDNHVWLNITRQQVRDLPDVSLDQSGE